MKRSQQNYFPIGFVAAAVFLLAGLAPATGQAVTLGFWCITNNNPVDCAIGEAQLTVNVTDLGGGQVNFRFDNAGPAASSITEVYFDDGTLLGLASVTHSAAKPWIGGSAAPPDLPGGNSISPPFNVTAFFLAEAAAPPPANGVQPGQYLDVVFNLQGGGTYADILSELVSGELRIGIHVIGFAGGGSESFVNNPVPVPAAVWFFGSALGLLGLLRRHQAALRT